MWPGNAVYISIHCNLFDFDATLLHPLPLYSTDNTFRYAIIDGNGFDANNQLLFFIDMSTIIYVADRKAYITMVWNIGYHSNEKWCNCFIRYIVEIIKMQSVAIIFFSGKYPIVNFIEMLPSPLPETNVKEILSIIERSVCNIIWSMPICLILFALIAAK